MEFIKDLSNQMTSRFESKLQNVVMKRSMTGTDFDSLCRDSRREILHEVCLRYLIIFHFRLKLLILNFIFF